MRIENGTLVRDQNGDSPGRYGDSCFDTSAFALSYFLVNSSYHASLNLDLFITEKGVVRHPLSPWREDDTTTDQELPLFMFMNTICNQKQKSFIYNCAMGDLKTGNNNYISLGYLAELQNLMWLRIVCLIIQVIFFWFPFYWNDGKWNKGEWPIGNAWTKSDGYLQWALIATSCPYIVRKLIRKSTLKQKITDYYSPEGTTADWLLNTHYEMIERFFK